MGLAAAAAALTITSDAADARHHHGLHVTYVHVVHAHVHQAEAHVHRHARSEDYSPPGASIVVDGNSGAVLEASNPDALRHPASLTKVMTLYLLFERLDAGKMRLDTPLNVSEHAADQDPTKLGLKPGSTIAVEDAIKGIVTRSANDAAVVIAENIGGDEETFAKMMTQKARALGMSRTTYVNASGLPDDDQNTTARDQALLGRAIQDRFPRYYKFFSTESFVFHGESIRGHNHLLGAVDGVDGIKTGFTRSSGFNLLTSVHRDGHFIVAVVMGGHSAFERDAHMRDLIGEHIKEASLRRTAPMIADSGESQIAFARTPMISAPMAAHADPTSTATVATANTRAAGNATRSATGTNDPIRPLLVRTVTFHTAPMQTAAMAPMPALVQVPQQVPQQVAQQAEVQPVALPQPVQQAVQLPVPVERPRTVVASADPAAPIAAPVASHVASAAPVQMQPARAEVATVAAPIAVPLTQPLAAEPALAEAPVQREPQVASAFSAPTAAAIHAHGGWLIQIGAFDDEDEAKQHLSDAQVKVRTALAAADPFTEKVQKGDKALYRARFAGFDKATAETACKELKRSDFQCMALKD